MIKNNLKTYITVSILSVLFSVGSLVPIGIISAISSIALVGLIGYTVTRFHYAFVGFLCICAFVPYALFAKDFASALYTYSQLALCSIALGICFNVKLSGIKTIGIVSAFHVIYILLTMLITGLGNNFTVLLSDTMQSLYPLYEGYISQADYHSIILTAIEMMTRLVPSFVVLSGVFTGLIYFGAFRLVLKMTHSESYCEKFSDCRADKTFSIIYFILSLISFLLPDNNYYSDIIMNVILITTFVFFIFGLSLIAYKLNISFGDSPKKKLLFALAVVSPLFIFGLPFTVIGYIGALDGIFDFRQNKAQKNTISKD